MSDQTELQKELGEAEPVETTESDLQAEPVDGAMAGAAATGAAAVAGSFQSEPRRQIPTRSPPHHSEKETIYVGNLFFDVTSADLTKEFEKFGEVKAAKVVTDSRGLSKGFGYLEFDNLASAKDAIASMHEQLFEGRRIMVAYAQQNMSSAAAARQNFSDAPRNPPTKTLFIGNMSFEMTDTDLNKLFKGVKNVVDVRVAVDRRTGQPRGFAHCDFIDVAAAQAAFAHLQGREIYGRRLRVDYSTVGGVSRRSRERMAEDQSM